MPIVRGCSQYANGAYCRLSDGRIFHSIYEGCVVRFYDERKIPKYAQEYFKIRRPLTYSSAIVYEDGIFRSTFADDGSFVDAPQWIMDLYERRNLNTQILTYKVPDECEHKYGLDKDTIRKVRANIQYSEENGSVLRKTIIVLQLLKTKNFKSEFRRNCMLRIREWINEDFQGPLPISNHEFIRLGYAKISQSV